MAKLLGCRHYWPSICVLSTLNRRVVLFTGAILLVLIDFLAASRPSMKAIFQDGLWPPFFLNKWAFSSLLLLLFMSNTPCIHVSLRREVSTGWCVSSAVCECQANPLVVCGVGQRRRVAAAFSLTVVLRFGSVDAS